MKTFNNIMNYLGKAHLRTMDVHSFKPQLYRLTEDSQRSAFESLLDKTPGMTVIDTIESQLRELIKSLHPSEKIRKEDYPQLIEKHLAGRDMHLYGVWVYYPWNRTVVHLLDEEEFVEVRTNRNRYKITREEQAVLGKKKIGIIGLSVGQSIALTLAMERTCGELRLADFDTAELSNLNRLRTGVHSLGLKKTVVAAREIAEIDPFLRVILFNDGVTDTNIDAFFGQGTDKLDVLVEVCDGLDIKINSRFKARQLGIPVVMDTNDRGLLDVERFDLEPQRPILHGLAEGLNPANIKGLSDEDKIPYILKMVNADNISRRLKASMMEVEQSINTWPQLASSVVLGGAITTDVCRRILLDQFRDSGRYYIDLDELIRDKDQPADERDTDVLVEDNPYTPLEVSEMREIARGYFNNESHRNGIGLNIPEIPKEKLDKIIDAIIAAPSAGNNQPWKVWYEKGLLFLFHDKYRSHSWGDYYEMGSHMSLGAALENIHLQSLSLELEDQITLFPLRDEPGLIAVIRFESADVQVDPALRRLSDGIYTRCTNRKNSVRKPLPEGLLNELNHYVSDFAGFRLLSVHDPDDLKTLGQVIASCDKIRLLQEKGHAEFFSEVRWNKEHAIRTRDGIELAAVDISEGEKAGFSVAQDWNAVELLSQWNKGDAFKKTSVKSVNSASAMLLFTAPELTHTRLLESGRLIERIWIHLNNRGISVHPMLSPVFFFNRLIHGKGIEIPESTQAELMRLRAKFTEIFPMRVDDREVFLMKLSISENMEAKALRLPKTEIFYRAHAESKSF